MKQDPHVTLYMFNIEKQAILTFPVAALNVYDHLKRMAFSSGVQGDLGLCSRMILGNQLQ